MKIYNIRNKIVRIGIEVFNVETMEQAFIRFCDVEKVTENILEIQRNPYNRIVRTFLANNYGIEIEGKQTGGVATGVRRR